MPFESWILPEMTPASVAAWGMGQHAVGGRGAALKDAESARKKEFRELDTLSCLKLH